MRALSVKSVAGQGANWVWTVGVERKTEKGMKKRKDLQLDNLDFKGSGRKEKKADISRENQRQRNT